MRRVHEGAAVRREFFRSAYLLGNALELATVDTTAKPARAPSLRQQLA